MIASRLIAVLAVTLLSQAATAASALTEFSSSMSSFTADFTQTVYDSDSVALQESSGQVSLMRPGRFRWTYDEPIKQLIVADGVTLWVYDEDIQQVTMQPQATTLGSAPIGLLSGEREIESEFSIVDLGLRDNLQWFQLEPKVQDTDFNAVYIALDDAGLRAMELRDNFGQATQIRFTNFKKNTDIAPEALQFEAPAGTDVIGEAGVAGQETDNAMPEDMAQQEEASVDSEQAVEPAANVAAEDAAPLSADDLLDDVDPANLQETADDEIGIAETLPLEEAEETTREITFEETVLPAE